MPTSVHESDMAKLERANKRLFCLLLVFIILFAGSICYIINLKTEYQQVTTKNEVVQDSESGNNSFVGGDLNGQAED